jgi:hypothetical protein
MESSHSYISSFLTLSYHKNDPHYYCFKSQVQLIATLLTQMRERSESGSESEKERMELQNYLTIATPGAVSAIPP